MTDFQRDERRRAFIRAMGNLNQALYHLRAAAGDNEKFDLRIELPSEKQLTEAINSCAHVYKQPGETPA